MKYTNRTRWIVLYIHIYNGKQKKKNKFDFYRNKKSTTNNN